MTDDALLILLPYLDVLERLKVAWEIVKRYNLKCATTPSLPMFSCDAGEHSALLTLREDDAPRIRPRDIVQFMLFTEDDYTCVSISYERTGKGKNLFLNWFYTFETALPTDKRYVWLLSDWQQAERARLADSLGAGKAGDAASIEGRHVAATQEVAQGEAATLDNATIQALISDSQTMSKHMSSSSYSPVTARAIREAIPKAWDLYIEESGRWGPGKVGRVASVSRDTISRYVSAWKKVGITKIDGIELW